jgi:hypothetical protein
MSDLRRTESARMAIELMTTWLECPDDEPARLVEYLRRHIDRQPSPNRHVVAAELIMGMTYIAGSLLVLRELEVGITAQETLLELALEYAQE